MPRDYEHLLDRNLDSVITLDGNPLALLLPHEAGEGSIDTIARGIKQLENTSSKLFILVSPLRNQKTFDLEESGCSVLVKEAFHNRPSKLKVETKKAKLLCEKFSGESTTIEETFLNDLELILYAIYQVQPEAKIIPIMIGTSEIEKSILLGRWVANEFSSHNPVIIALSKLDNEGLSVAEYCDSARFSRYCLQQLENQSKLDFPFPPVVAALEFANLRGAHTFTTITSKIDQTKLDRTQVNLTSAMLWEYQPPHFSIEQKNTLLNIGLEAIKAYLTTKMIPDYQTDDPILKRKSGVFITIRKNSFLRGCIGRMSADEPLYKAVQKLAIAAATSDPRFSPLEIRDLKHITLKISILSPLQKMDVGQIEIGKHGLLISHKGQRGVLLPEVPVERDWDVATFLSHLCMKAGLHSDALEENPALYGFTSIEFSNQPA